MKADGNEEDSLSVIGTRLLSEVFFHHSYDFSILFDKLVDKVRLHLQNILFFRIFEFNLKFLQSYLD